MVLSTSSDATKRIAALNDAFRTTFLGGSIYVTPGLQSLGEDFVKAVLLAVRVFSTFDNDNDPYGEHDFGSLTIEGRKLFWKIDYFDPSLIFGSENPADTKVTRRVLTVMLADEF
ncbi:DUF3768 domain-containing protein [Mesorhizobium sp. 10J20-29]